jgi:hypothetical protein
VRGTVKEHYLTESAQTVAGEGGIHERSHTSIVDNGIVVTTGH